MGRGFLCELAEGGMERPLSNTSYLAVTIFNYERFSLANNLDQYLVPLSLYGVDEVRNSRKEAHCFEDDARTAFVNRGQTR